MDHTLDADVIVIGAGPTGLMLAGELRLGRASVIVAEQLTKPTGQSRALGFTARTLETFDQRGLTPRFGGLETSAMGHFGSVPFDYTILEGAHFGARGIPQSTTEAILEQWALELGADIRRGHTFTALDQADDHVTVTLTTPDGTPRHLRARFVVGADGARSPVRKAARIDFPGTGGTQLMYLADVADSGVRLRPLGERLPGGLVQVFPMPEGIARIILSVHGTHPTPDSDTPHYTDVARAWHQVTGEDISHGNALWVSSFTDATRQATHYRNHRVLLAGDAAHIHLPAGGQGMSTGIQDAVNLGWKLAATVQHRAPHHLLDTYHSERHPVGARLLSNTRAQGMALFGGDETQALRDLYTELIALDDVKRHLAGAVSHLDIHYDMGENAHPLAGHRLPPHTLTTLTGPQHTPDLLHHAQGLFLDLTDNHELRTTLTGWKDRITTHTGTPTTPGPLDNLTALLIRPDGYIAWATETDDNPTTLTHALHHWFGNPTTP
ncbi:FAD-dependent monooxygenase [Streptomyces sp. NA04227]|uniref:FAD-dependent monooxygenase n=1 Tax=Streptomyces sp. NA04227 TaxID=2742136 RepID=UPI0015928F10|nr:FAD-dependent monooxygenase [Streptomyces sp. NA04227]QKW05003.1 FAD-dependent monooxygenase [Streptomyces sp. NA04227]